MPKSFASCVTRRTVIKTAAVAAAGVVASPALEAAAVSAPALLRLPSKAPSGSFTFWNRGFAPHERGYQAVIDLYNQQVNANVTINRESFPPAEYDTKLRSAMAASNPPDLFNGHGTMLGEFATAGFLLALDPNVVTTDQVKTEFLLEQYLQSAPWGNIFGIGVPDPPGDSGIVINTALAEEAGVTPPTEFASTEELFAAAEMMTKRQGDQVLQAGLGFNEGNDPVYVLSFIVEQGGRFWDNDTQTFDFSTPEAEKALQLVADIYLTKHVDSLDLPVDFDALSQGVKASAFIWPEFSNYAKTVFPDLQLTFAGKPPFVAGNVPIFNHTDTWNAMAFAGTKNPEAVEDFLRFLTTPEAQLAFAAHNPGLAIQKQVVFDDPFYQSGGGAFLAPVIASIKAGQERFFGPFGNLDTLIYDIWWPLMQEVFQGQTSVQDSLTKMTEASNADVSGYRERYPDAPETTIYWTPEELPEGLSWS